MDIDSERDTLCDTLEGVHQKPCRTCRERKVRCSKIKPCSNCQRADIECVYDEPPQARSKTGQTAAALAERVIELETVVQQLKEQIAAGRNDALIGPRPGTLSADPPRNFIAEKVLDRLLVDQSEYRGTFTATGPGRLVCESGSSRHLLDSFWAGRYEDIEDLRFVLAPETHITSNIQWLHGIGDKLLPAMSLYLSPAKSHRLVQAYITNVDQSVRVLHTPTLRKNVNHFWRGILPDFPSFEPQLAIVYCLGLLSLSAQECQDLFGEARDSLMSKFRAQTEQGLAVLELATTHKISSLQTFILYISYLVFVGDILLASSLVGLAVRIGQRLGIHRNGNHFHVSPWDTELRRRLWHHLLLLDTLCMETHGLESAIPHGFSDTSLPVNANDSDWDVLQSSTSPPRARKGYTDMTLALMQYEMAAIMRIILNCKISGMENEESDMQVHTQLLQESFERIEQVYLVGLLESDSHQLLVTETAKLTFERMRLTQMQLFAREVGSRPTDPVQPAARRLLHAVEYCQHVQVAQEKFASANLDWVIVRAFCWHSLMIMLSTSLRNNVVNEDENVKWALNRLLSLFKDRPSIDYLKENGVLWQPLEKLMSELRYVTRRSI